LTEKEKREMTDPPQIYDPPPRQQAADQTQAASAALGVTGLAMIIAGASGSTSEALLGAGRDAAVQAAMLFRFDTVPGSLRWGIVVTAVSVALNLISLWLRFQSRKEQAKKAAAARPK
jgi:hypothetical protein